MSPLPACEKDKNKKEGQGVRNCALYGEARWRCKRGALSGPVASQPSRARHPAIMKPSNGAGPVTDPRSSSHPARCRDPAAGERVIGTTRTKKDSFEI